MNDTTKGKTMKFNNTLAQEAYELINTRAIEEIKKLVDLARALPKQELFTAATQIANCKILFTTMAINTAMDIETKTANTLVDISKITADLPD
jgi:hypothetical protein